MRLEIFSEGRESSSDGLMVSAKNRRLVVAFQSVPVSKNSIEKLFFINYSLPFAAH